jgi:hypothetical protein
MRRWLLVISAGISFVLCVSSLWLWARSLWIMDNCETVVYSFDNGVLQMKSLDIFSSGGAIYVSRVFIQGPDALKSDAERQAVMKQNGWRHVAGEIRYTAQWYFEAGRSCLTAFSYTRQCNLADRYESIFTEQTHPKKVQPIGRICRQGTKGGHHARSSHTVSPPRRFPVLVEAQRPSPKPHLLHDKLPNEPICHHFVIRRPGGKRTHRNLSKRTQKPRYRSKNATFRCLRRTFFDGTNPNSCAPKPSTLAPPLRRKFSTFTTPLLLR